MTTFNDIVEEVLLNLEGFSENENIYGTIVAVSPDESSITISGSDYPDGSGFSAGIIEIGDELILANSFDRGTGVFTNLIRGYRNTPRNATLELGMLVRNKPSIPRYAIKRSINDTIRSLHPRIFAVKSFEFISTGARETYDLPAETNSILSVQILVPGATRSWVRSRRYNFDSVAGSNSTTGKSLRILDAPAGSPIQVVYTAEAAPLVSGDDNFETTTGLPDWSRDIIVYGTCWRVVSFIEASKSFAHSVTQQMLNGQPYNPQGGAVNLAKYFLGMFNNRLADAELRFRNLYPAQKHFNS